MNTRFRERKSAPPVITVQPVFKAAEMPDFKRLHEMYRPKQSEAELTMPVCFDLVSEKRRLKAMDIAAEKKRVVDEEEQAKR